MSEQQLCPNSNSTSGLPMNGEMPEARYVRMNARKMRDAVGYSMASKHGLDDTTAVSSVVASRARECGTQMECNCQRSYDGC